MNTDFGHKLRYHRKSKKLTIKDLANKVGVHYTMISRYENGVNNPSVDVLKKLADALDVKQSELFGEELKIDGVDGASRELIERAENLGLEWIALSEKMKDRKFTAKEIEELLDVIEAMKRRR